MFAGMYLRGKTAYLEDSLIMLEKGFSDDKKNVEFQGIFKVHRLHLRMD